MSNLVRLLNPVTASSFVNLVDCTEYQMAHSITIWKDSFPNLEEYDLAIIGVEEDREAINNTGCSNAPNQIRKALYKLYNWESNLKLIDLGNIIKGYESSQTYNNLAEVVRELLKNNVIPIIIGGSNDNLIGQYNAYDENQTSVNLTNIDESIDFTGSEGANYKITSKNFLNSILNDGAVPLNNFSAIGFQTFLTNPMVADIMDQHSFEAYRLGNVRENIAELEPILRDTDLLSIDVSAIRLSDAPGNKNASPNGLLGEECCKIFRYAGMSDHISSLGIYEYNPDFDRNGQTGQLLAQMIWYFIEGYYSRKGEKDPGLEPEKYMKYLVQIDETELIFFKNKDDEKWWVEVPNAKSKRHQYIACSYTDYQLACNEELPDRWLMAVQKG